MTAAYVGIVVGLWYLVAPFVWGYPFGFLWWNDLMIGAVVIALSFSFTMGPSRITGWLLIAVGAYSMFAPFIHGYLWPAQPFFNDLVFGAVVVGVGAMVNATGIALTERRGTLP